MEESKAMIRLRQLFSVFGLVVLSTAFIGCAAAPRRSAEVQFLEPAALMRFSDLPVPAGYKILPKESFVLETGGVRAGVLRYRGKGDAHSALLFYKNQMPLYNWALLHVLEYGELMLNFERENEGCIIKIKPAGRGVKLSISLAPKSPMPAPAPLKEKKAVK